MMQMQSTAVNTAEFENLREVLFHTTGTEKYETVLSTAQQHITNTIDTDLNDMSEANFRDIILKYITDYSVTCELTDSPSKLADYIYHDMAGWSFISREHLLDQDGFEELDVNGWNDVDIIVYGKRSKTNFKFLNPQHANDILRRMLQKTSAKFDNAVPYAVTDLGKGIRIAALKNPIIDEDMGVAFSIRKVSNVTITKDKLIESALTEKMLEMLILFFTHGVSICFSGETGSGKTTLAGYLLKKAARKLRTYTIEEGSREWDFYEYDGDGNILNSVIHTKTLPNDDPKLNFDQNKLLQMALRFNPSIIGVGEMRSDEAYAAAEASNTGHVVGTTVHANSAIDAPARIVGLCKKAYDFSDDTLMSLVVNAFPIQVYQEFLPDGKRRVTEIIEVLGYKNGKLEYNTLVEFFVEDNEVDPETGEVIRVMGDFVWRNPISPHLHQKMLKKGATKAQLEPFRSIIGNI